MQDSLSTVFSALADPTRRAILARLAQGDASVSELAAPFHLTPRAISKHVGVLERAGLVSRSRKAQQRPSSLRVAPLVHVDEWLKGYRHLWQARFEKIDRVLEKIKKGELDDPRKRSR